MKEIETLLCLLPISHKAPPPAVTLLYIMDQPLSLAQSHHDQPQGRGRQGQGQAGHPGCGRGEIHRRQGDPHCVPRHQVLSTERHLYSIHYIDDLKTWSTDAS